MGKIIPLRPTPDPDYRYRTGWWYTLNTKTGASFIEAYRTPWNGSWFDFYPMESEAEAAAFATRMANELPDHVYEGGPECHGHF